MRKKFVCFFLTFLLLSSPVLAEERDVSNHYGVNKKWQMNDDRISHALNTPYVDALDKIYDYANILTSDEESEYGEKFRDLVDEINMDIVFVSIDMSYVFDDQNEDYAADFYDYNDFGLDFDYYSGILLLRNTYKTAPYFNIYTFGEAQLLYDTDRLEIILDDIYPYFSSGNYTDGLDLFLEDLEDYYNKGLSKEAKKYYIDDMGYIQQKYQPPYLFAFVASSIVTAIIISIFVSRNKMVKKATQANDYLNKETAHITEKQDNFVNTHTSSYVMSSSSSSGGGGGFSSSGGSSGGGHSSGGGRHG